MYSTHVCFFFFQNRRDRQEQEQHNLWLDFKKIEEEEENSAMK
jgi:hypothetical protein